MRQGTTEVRLDLERGAQHPHGPLGADPDARRGQGTIRKQLGTKGGTKMLPRFVAEVATLWVEFGRRYVVPGTPTGTRRVASAGGTAAIHCATNGAAIQSRMPGG